MQFLHSPQVAYMHLRRWQTMLISGALALAGCTAALAANAPFPTVTTPVKVDGTAVGDPVWNRVLNTIVYANGAYHMWYVGNNYLLSAGIGYATSTDGVNFTTAGTLTAPANWWISGGATAEPWANYLRVSRNGSGDWTLMVWHPNSDTGAFGSYNYNTSLWNLGATISNLSPTAIGPLPSQPGGNHVGPYGIVGNNIYLGQDTAGAFGRYTLPMVGPVSPMPDIADVYAGTGFCWFSCADTPNRSYIHNYGRTLDQGSNILGTYYTIYDYNSWTRRAKQLWYIESTDNGATWGAPQGLFTNGAAVTVDGLPNTGNFALPEVASLGGGQYRSYFNTVDACGNYVTVTAALPGQASGLAVTKAFSPSTVMPGGESELTVTLTAPAATCTPAEGIPAPTTAYSSIGFIDTLPDGMTLANAPAPSTTCAGATVTATAGGDRFSLNNNATLAPGASCTVTVRVTVAGAGNFRNTIPVSAITNAQSVPALADAVAELRSSVATATPVPTLGHFALGSLALLMASLGVRHLRPASSRRKV